jgi:hypothetical protein
MTKSVRLYLDRFGQDALARFARRRRDSKGSVLRTATLYYLADEGARRPAWRVPRFLRPRAEARSAALELDLDDETWSALSEEADRQGVDPERLAEHAVLYFLADLDSGRLAGRLDNAVNPEEDAPLG